MVRLLVVVAFVGVLGAARRADAAKIPIVWTSGEEIFESGPLPEPYAHDPALAGAQAGYVCDVTGVFWSYFSISNCRAAAIRGTSYDATSDLAKAVAAKYPSPDVPFWAAHGWQVMIGGLVVLVAAGIFVRRRRPRVGAYDDEETTDHVRSRRPTPRPQPVPVNVAPPSHLQPQAPYAHQQAYAQGHYAQGAHAQQAYAQQQYAFAQQQPPPAQQPYLPPMPLADDGPTTADPTWQANAERHYAQHQQRYARGSYTEQDYEQRTALGVAPRKRGTV